MKDNEFNLIACGPWLQFSLRKRILLALRYWLPWVLEAAWNSKYLWWRYFLWKCFKARPVLWCDIIEAPDKEDLTEVVFPSLYWSLTLAGKGDWLWYESERQLMRNKDKIDYEVDWEGKGSGWYPFW